MLDEAPRIDPRTEADIVAEVATNAARLTVDLAPPTPAALIGRTLDQDVLDSTRRVVASAGTVIDDALAARISELPDPGRVPVRGWQFPPDGRPEAGMALIHIFGHYAALIVERLNRVPEKHFLAFLDLIGARVRPPQPARVPLRFELAPGSLLDALVPIGTQATAPGQSDADTEPVVFETERPLLVTAARLVRGFVREPDTDRSASYSGVELAGLEAPVPAFAGTEPIEHSLYLARDDYFGLKGPKRAILTFDSPDAARLAALPIVWEFWDAEVWQPLASTAALATLVGTTWQPVVFDWRLGPAEQQKVSRCIVTLSDLPPPAPREVDGVEAMWVRGRVTSALPPSHDPDPLPIRRRGLNPDALVVGRTPLDARTPFYPFGQTEPLSKFFYLSADEAFVRAGAAVTLTVTLDGTAVGSADLVLGWRYFDGTDWRELGQSTPSSPTSGSTTWSFADATRAFTGSGEVTFTTPLIWARSTIFGRAGRWLRIELVSGGYGAAGTFRPPFVRSALVSYTWTPPTLRAITVGASVQPSTLVAPDLAFFNGVPIDLGKDLYPFGERPRYNDTLYLASQEVFSKPGAAVTIDVVVTNPVDTTTPAPPIPRVVPDSVEIAWEAWNGRAWQQLGKSKPGTNGESIGETQFGFFDATLAFTKSGQVRFTGPTWVAPTIVNGETSSWVRARLVKGNFGKEATYTPVTGGGYTYTAATFAPPVLASVRLGYVYEPSGPPTACKTYNNFVYANQSTVPSAPPFQPLVTMLDRRPALYLAFDMPLPNRSITLYVHPSTPAQDAEAAGFDGPQSSPVTWEYAAPAGWIPLGVHDESHAFVERGLIIFVGPPDQVQRIEFGHAAFWLRARWETGSASVGPLIRRLLTNTTWASQTQSIRNEILGSSDGGPRQTFRTPRSPLLEGELIEVIEQPQTAEADRLQEDVWVLWTSVADFHASGPGDRHYVVDRLTGDVRFGDGQHGMMPPRGRNNIRAADYRSGGGSRGNVPAETIVQLLTTVPYVAGVSNPEAAQGGADSETTRDLQERGPRELRHGGRATTAVDFEDLALQASPEIARVRALTPRFSSTNLQWLDPLQPVASGDLSAYLAVNAGHVTLIVVPHSQEARPVPSADLTRRVRSYVQERCAPNLELLVDPPDWVEVTVTTEVVPTSLQSTDALRIAVDTALAQYLHPLHGGPGRSGWLFGQRPNAADLYPLIESLVGVDHVSTLAVRARELGTVRPERSLIFSGQHEITLSWTASGG